MKLLCRWFGCAYRRKGDQVLCRRCGQRNELIEQIMDMDPLDTLLHPPRLPEE